jgi:23S rRNA (guanosine2251-2'-O)-methyltransferase
MKNITFGIHAVTSLLDTQPERISSLILLKGRDDRKLQAIVDLAKKHNVSLTRVDRKVLDTQCSQNHQGVVALCVSSRRFGENDLFEMLAASTEPALLLVLDGVQDPHNLGACMRSAAAMGVHAVIAPKDNAVAITSVVEKVACGGVDVVPFVAVTNLARTLKELQQLGIWLVGLDGQSELAIGDVDLTGAIAIVMGGEGSGMRRLTKKHCDYLAKIPMSGNIESLNVSVATGVALYEVSRQKK